MEEVGVVALLAGLWVALSSPSRGPGRGGSGDVPVSSGGPDRTLVTLGWALVAAAIVLLLTAAITLPMVSVGSLPSARSASNPGSVDQP